MRINAGADFTDAGAATWFFTTSTGLVDIRGFLQNALIFKGAIKVFVRKWVAHANIHCLSLLKDKGNVLQLRIIRKENKVYSQQ